MGWYFIVLKKYFVFEGRARRKEYWMFLLFNFIFAFLYGFLVGFLNGFFNTDLYYLSNIYTLAVFIPSIAVWVRRLHDVGKSGWWMLLSFVPIIGWIWLFVLNVTDSEGDNRYGPNPKEKLTVL